jgi:general secretion pathway protein D
MQKSEERQPRMNRLKIASASAALLLLLPIGACTSYSSYQKAVTAEKSKNWDDAVTYYEKALDVDPGNTHYRLALTRARLEASRAHFERGKSLKNAAQHATGAEQFRLAQLAATELELTVKLDTTNQYAAVELDKTVTMMQDLTRAADSNSIDEMKKRVKANTSKAQPPVLNPASDQPISLNFSHETPVKDIYRALGNAFGINILYDQAVKDDRISIELKDVTAQQALERLMQAANHFYKVLDEHTIIVVPDNPQARRDYEDLVIRTFYLSNGDAEQVTNVVRTMIEARNVFPLKALNAITIRDTRDKVLIAEKIIEANDKAKAEVVVDVELLQLDSTKLRDIGVAFSTNGSSGLAFGASIIPPSGTTTSTATDSTGTGTTTVTTGGGPLTLPFLRGLNSGNFSFTVPNSVLVSLIKNATDSESLANPELRISEGEKATLHIGKRIPVPVSTFSSVNTGQTGNTFAPVTSYQYQDVGIKVSIEPRVHHNREVTLKLTVEVSDSAGNAPGSNPPQPIISTRTIESTIRLKDGETNFLAGLIQRNDTTSADTTPFLGDLPIIGRLFNHEHKDHTRTDLMLSMTPHIVRIPDITEDDLAPMWVGTTNNLTFRGVSPRIESQASVDPFTAQNSTPVNSTLQLSSDGEPGNFIQPQGGGRSRGNADQTPVIAPPASAPSDPFRNNTPTPNAPPPADPEPQVRNESTSSSLSTSSSSKSAAMSSASFNASTFGGDMARVATPRIAPQPSTLALKPGEEKIWNVVGMDLDGLTTNAIQLHYDPQTLNVNEVMFGPALEFDPRTPPVATINSQNGTIRIVSSDGKPLVFASGGEVAMLRVHGGGPGQSFLVMDSPELHDRGGENVASAISGGRLKVQ